MTPNQIKLLSDYCLKYPDRADIINVIAAIHSIGPLQEPLLTIFKENVDRVFKLSDVAYVRENPKKRKPYKQRHKH